MKLSKKTTSLTLLTSLSLLTGPALLANYTLTILHNNDGESQLIDAGENYGGIARFVSLVNATRAEYQGMGHGVITLSSGDNFLAGPEFNASSATQGSDTPIYYDALGLSAIGYDAIILGNHDFDFGPVVLANFISDVDASIPYLSANLDFTNEPALKPLADQNRIAASTVVEVSTAAGTKRVGVVGATTPNLHFISSPGAVEVMQDVKTAVQSEIDSLTSGDMPVDVVIFVSHLQGIAEDQAIIPELTGVDIAIAGGGDDLLANADALLLPGDEADPAKPYPLLSSNNVPIVTTSGEYKYLGRLTVEFNDANEIVSVSGNPIRVIDASIADDGVAPDATMLTTVTNPVMNHLAALSQDIIATTDVPLDGRRNFIRSVETNLGNLFADAMLSSARARATEFMVEGTIDVAVVGGGGIRNGNILNSAGNMDAPLTMLNTFDIAPFTNFVSVVENVTPQQLLNLVENNVSQNSLRAGAIEPTGAGTGRFGQIAGMTVVYDILAPALVLDGGNNIIQAGERVRSITLDNGTKIVEDGMVVPGAPNVGVVVTSFHAVGGDQFFWDMETIPSTTVGLSYQQSLAEYLENGLSGEVTAAQYPANPRQRIMVLGAPSFLLNATVSGGMLTSPWFGSFYGYDDSSWVSHIALDDIYLYNFSMPESLIMYSAAWGDFWYTGESLFPWVYSFSKGWLWFYVAGDVAYYYEFDSGNWFMFQ